MGEAIDTVDTAETTDMQRHDEQDGRDERGRFAKGNRHGWLRGQTGNAKGRRDALSDTLRRKLEEPYDHGRTRREALIDTLINEAINGSIRAAELVITRLEGRMPVTSSATVDIHVSRSEFFQYEAKVTELQDIAERRGTPINRAKAVKLLAASDPRILTVMYEADDDE